MKGSLWACAPGSLQRIKMQLLMVAFACPLHRNAHLSQDHRCTQRMLRSSQFRLPVTDGGPECAIRCSANQIYLHFDHVLVQRLSRQHRRGAVHDRTPPVPQEGAFTNSEQRTSTALASILSHSGWTRHQGCRTVTRMGFFAARTCTTALWTLSIVSIGI